MSFQAVEIKNATVGATPLTLSSTLFNFASSNLTGAQKAIICPTSASLRISSATTAPSTVALGIPVSSGTAYEVIGTANVANLYMVATTTSANVCVEIYK
jgi:hypothetical protein